MLRAVKQADAHLFLWRVGIHLGYFLTIDEDALDAAHRLQIAIQLDRRAIKDDLQCAVKTICLKRDPMIIAAIEQIRIILIRIPLADISHLIDAHTDIKIVDERIRFSLYRLR